MANSEKVTLSLAICEYDHVHDLISGTVPVEGIGLNIQTFPIQEIFYRFTRHREWDVSEMSLGMYVSLLSQGDASLTAIPVFTSRMFRQSAFFVRRDGPVRTAEDLRGRRIGCPDWSHTAGIYARGFLAHDLGIPIEDLEWVQAGVNEPGRAEQLEMKYPAGMKRSVEAEKSLDRMLLSGEIDVVLSSHPPKSALADDAPVVRLFNGGMAEESKYFKRTGIFPIMHVVAMRRDVHERHPWAAMNLYTAFEEAKRRSLARMMDSTISRYPFPWTFEYAKHAKALFGADFWPYGIDRNRTTLEAFLAFAFEQGVAHRPVKLDELFPPEVASVFKI
jgi:4,5-dihydroxyphthalate decarboxylase